MADPPTISLGHKYVTIIDAGSSGTRAYVYRYATNDDGHAILPLELTLVKSFKSARTRMLLYPSPQEVSSLSEIFI
jgi:GDA1/CD39 (nucleoside phosphatase) family